MGHFASLPAYMRWKSPQIADLLFSGWHGLYDWSPILLFATLGLFIYRQSFWHPAVRSMTYGPARENAVGNILVKGVS